MTALYQAYKAKTSNDPRELRALQDRGQIVKNVLKGSGYGAAGGASFAFASKAATPYLASKLGVGGVFAADALGGVAAQGTVDLIRGQRSSGGSYLLSAALGPAARLFGLGGKRILGGRAGFQQALGKLNRVVERSRQPCPPLRQRFLDYMQRGAENDAHWLQLTKAERALYERGQRTFPEKFFRDKNLGQFTEGRTGADYVQGVVERGRWLQQNHPIRSHPANAVAGAHDFLEGMRHTLSSGPSPAVRQNRVIKYILDRAAGVKPGS